MREYCTQNDGDCGSCSLVNYGRDCLNNPLSDVDLLEDCLDSFGPEKQANKKPVDNGVPNRIGGVAMGSGPRKYDTKAHISVDRETWTKFKAYCQGMNMSPADTFNIMMVGVISSSRLEGLFNSIVDRLIEEKEKQTKKRGNQQ